MCFFYNGFQRSTPFLDIPQTAILIRFRVTQRLPLTLQWHLCSTYISISFQFQDGRCTLVKLLAVRHDKSLNDHVLTSYPVAKEDDCQLKCFMHELCVSYNLGPVLDNGIRDCEISKSDEFRDPQNMTDRPGYFYRGIEVCALRAVSFCASLSLTTHRERLGELMRLSSIDTSKMIQILEENILLEIKAMSSLSCTKNRI